MGRGVFAGRAYRKDEAIEVRPVIRLAATATDVATVGRGHDVFRWGAGAGELAVALGYGSLYNHSTAPNVRFTPRRACDDIVFRAVRDIAAGEQIFIDYEWDAADHAAFDAAP